MAKVELAREAEANLRRLPAMYQHAVADAIDGLDVEPVRGKPLRGRLAHLRSLRVGVYRIIHRFNTRTKILIVETVRHRSEAYR